MKQNMIQTQISLKREQYDAAKLRAFYEGISLSEIIRQALELRLKQAKPTIYGKQFFEEIAGEEKKGKR